MLIHKASVRLGIHCTSFNFPTFGFKEVHPVSYPMGRRGSFPKGKSGRNVKLSTHLHQSQI